MKRWSPSARSFFAPPKMARAAIPTAAPDLPFLEMPRCQPAKSNPASEVSRQGVGQKMGQVTKEIRAAVDAARPEDIAGRWRAFLRAQYPAAGRTKAIAQEFDCPVKTAERWLAEDGPAPSAVNLLRAGLIFGFPALESVLMPAAQAGPARRTTITDIAAKLDDLAAQMARIREVTCPRS